jgi:hypothetical protein
VGIGDTNPQYPLQVIGNAVVNGNIYGQNIIAANNILIGTLRMINSPIYGGVDSITSGATALHIAIDTVRTNNYFNAQTVAAGGLAGGKISINGQLSTIFSTSNFINFGNDSLFTLGTVKSGGLNISGSNVTMPGLISDTNSHLLGIDKHGNVTALSNSGIASTIYPYPPNTSAGPCDSANALWYSQPVFGAKELVTNVCN